MLYTWSSENTIYTSIVIFNSCEIKKKNKKESRKKCVGQDDEQAQVLPHKSIVDFFFIYYYFYSCVLRWPVDRWKLYIAQEKLVHTRHLLKHPVINNTLTQNIDLSISKVSLTFIISLDNIYDNYTLSQILFTTNNNDTTINSFINHLFKKIRWKIFH